jgi:hypothetical protein
MFFRISRQRNALIAPIAHFFCSQYDSMMAADKDPQDKAKKNTRRNWTSREDDNDHSILESKGVLDFCGRIISQLVGSSDN